MTYGTLIQTATAGAGGIASLDFNSIPQTYTDLILVWSVRTNVSGANDVMRLWFNGSSANYTNRELSGNGSTASSGTGTDNASFAVGNTATANTFSSNQIYIPNYTGNTNKVISIDGVTENNATASLQNLIAGLWSQTAAITSLSLKATNGTSTLLQYSTASLYGIK